MTTFAAPIETTTTGTARLAALTALAGRGAGPDELTPRELDVIHLITQGMSNTEIADTLFLSINSVKSYVQIAYRKIGATSRSQAVIWGARHGLLDGVPHTARS